MFVNDTVNERKYYKEVCTYGKQPALHAVFIRCERCAIIFKQLISILKTFAHSSTMFPQQRTHVKYNRGFFTLHILLWCYTLEFPLTNYTIWQPKKKSGN